MIEEGDEYDRRLERVAWIVDRLRDHDAPEEMIENLQRAFIALARPYPDDMRSILSNLSSFIQNELEKQKRAGPSPARAGGHMPQSLISAIAFEIITEITQDFQIAPPLKKVLIELFGIGGYRAKESRAREERHTAAQLIAIRPSLGNSELARLLGINRKTIIDWRKNTKFQNEIQEIKNKVEEPGWEAVVKDAIRYYFLSNEKPIPDLD